MNDLKLWYEGPAAGWAQGLPLGNGRMGGVIISAPHKEVWSLTEVTYWSGQAEPCHGRSNTKQDLERMRERFLRAIMPLATSWRRSICSRPSATSARI